MRGCGVRGDDLFGLEQCGQNGRDRRRVVVDQLLRGDKDEMGVVAGDRDFPIFLAEGLLGAAVERREHGAGKDVAA